MRGHTQPGMPLTPYALRIASGDGSGVSIPIPLGGLLLGREQGDGAVAGDSLVSRRHAQISRDAQGRLHLEDLGSRNGTFLNGARVSTRRPLETGDIIKIGGSHLHVVDGTSDSVDAQGLLPVHGELQRPRDGEWAWIGADVPSTTPARTAAASAADQLHPSAVEAPAPRTDRPRARSRGHATVVGQVRGIQQRSEDLGDGRAGSVWTFRVERYDEAGNRRRPVPVQMRAGAIEGVLTEGDEVRVVGRWRDGTLHSNHVHNVTTHSAVKARSVRGTLVLLAVVALAAVAFVVFLVLADRSFQDQVDQDQRTFLEQVERGQQSFCDEAERLGHPATDC
jgi:hypothetical protein